MHFHSSARCMTCLTIRTFSTPIPNILVLSSMCRTCGWNDCIGFEAGQVCIPCRTMWQKDVTRELTHLKESLAAR